ncbi:glycosyltransferase [Microbacterium sp. CIAB417]|uniref:glycosyltransferase n=1 Tax=Microbacterium sp. CIAB417 TaxID=2860287 RepID=UPI001FAE5C5E
MTVLTCEREVFLQSTGIDASLEARIDPDIRVVRTEFPVREIDSDLRSWGRARAMAPELWNVWEARRTRKVFPEPRYALWRPVLEREALRIHATDPVDLVIGSANPNVVHTAGHLLHEQHGVPFVMDYRDTWQLDMYGGRRTLSDRHPGAVWERRLISTAAEAWFVNEPIAQWHRELYPEHAIKMRVVPNGFDRDFVDAPVPPSGPADRQIVFGNIGTMTAQTPIPELIAGWSAGRSQGSLNDARIDLYGYLGHQGNDDGGILGYVESVRDGSVRYRGPVKKAQIAQTYAQLDVLVLPLGTSRFMTSGKVFEYMATGLPIVSVHDPVNAVTDTLRGYPGWFAVSSLGPDEIGRALVSAAQYARTQTLQDRLAARAWADRYDRRNILQPIATRWRDRAAYAGHAA